MDILYMLVVFPLESIIETFYVLVLKVFKEPSIAICGVSLAVSVLTLPLYFMAERHQKEERDIRKILRPEASNIKAVFRGDEQYMMLATWYRQNNYHPLYALRSSLGIIIQIPFFIAAYNFLSRLEDLNGVSFLFIKDLSLSDAALRIGGLAINVLPVIMTLINVVSGVIYTKGFPIKDKIQLYGMACVFLLMLYNSAAGLVLYWTCNNIFSLAKNILQKAKHPKKIVYAASSLCAVFLAIYVVFFREGPPVKNMLIALVCIQVVFVPLWKKLITILVSQISRCARPESSAFSLPKTFFFSASALVLLAGLVIPSNLITSNVAEFSFIKPAESPLIFIWMALLQSCGIMLWLLCVYFLFNRRIKILLAGAITMALAVFTVNTFFFAGSYGFMMVDLHLSDFSGGSWQLNLVNIFAGLMICLLIFVLGVMKKKVLFSAQVITIAAFLVTGILNVVKIENTFASTQPVEQALPQDKTVYTFSKTGKNILVIILDRGISGYVPYIFEEKPELSRSLSGFTYYPNCISFGPFTVYGMPGIFGGYRYTPVEMQKRKDERFLKKYRESMQVLPRILAKDGFVVTVSDQPWMDNTLYKGADNIKVENIEGRYTDFYMAQNKNIFLAYYYSKIKNNLIRFSFFKFMPLIVRGIVYDKGRYLSAHDIFRGQTNYSKSTLGHYSSLYYLSEITGITGENKDFATLFVNDLTHEPAFFEAPDYKCAPEITNKGSGPFASEDHYHVNMAAFLMLGKWFDFLKKNNVYDNTKIILVSDHGGNIRSPFPNNIILPNGVDLEAYAALLMVKDFYADGVLRTDDTFMTSADAPLLVTEGIIEKPLDPFNGKPLIQDKERGATITTASLWQLEKQLRYTYDIKPNEWLHVRDNIFDVKNWTKQTIKTF
jgi:YidC/Oxa1 family membrane protein insertase